VKLFGRGEENKPNNQESKRKISLEANKILVDSVDPLARILGGPIQSQNSNPDQQNVKPDARSEVELGLPQLVRK
jgi:hypothetical protein